jgi:hypothetical protein
VIYVFGGYDQMIAIGLKADTITGVSSCPRTTRTG